MIVNATPNIEAIPSDAPVVTSYSVGNFGDPAAPSSPPITNSFLADFPLDALHPTQRAIVEAVSSTYQQHPSLAGMASLAMIGGSMGRGFAVANAAPGSITFGNVYIVVAEERSKGKGSAGRVIAEPIIEANSEAKRRYKEEDLPRIKARLRELARLRKAATESVDSNATDQDAIEREIASLEAQAKVSPTLYTGSATGAAITELLERNDELLMMYSPEAGDCLKVALGRYTSDSSADIDLLLSGYSVESFSESRVSRGDKHFSRPCISLCWFVQPSLLKELLGDEDAVDRGLPARFLYAVPPPTVIPYDTGEIEEISPSLKEDWRRLINQVLQHRDQETVHIGCHPEAKELFRQFHNEIVSLRNDIYREIQGDLGRAREIAIRIALGQCVLDAKSCGEDPTEITPDQAERAIRVVRFSLGQFVGALVPARAAKWQGDLKRVASHCSEDGSITLNDLKRKHSIDRETVEELVRRFPSCIQIETIPPGPNGGRPSEVARIRGGFCR